MTAQLEFAYAQARLQARHGAMAGAPLWRALDASRTAAQYLRQARSGSLAAWTEGLDAADDAHHVERHLRSRWNRQVDTVARWPPPRWRAATRTFGRLPELALTDPPRPGGVVLAQWLVDWQRLWPPDAGDPALLRQPAELLLPRLRDSAAVRAADSEATAHALRRLLRRHAASAVAVFAYLGLVALEIERLRGGLVVRILFESAHGTPSDAPAHPEPPVTPARGTVKDR